MSIRIIKVKGRKYAQEVEYRWDPLKKVGRTIVLRHIGPLNREDTKNKFLCINSKNKKIGKTVNQKKPLIEKQVELVPLTPPSDLITEVLRLIEDSDEANGRKEVYNLYLQTYQKSPNNPQALKKQIGFSLTILERNGKISRSGKGGLHDPYKYSSNG